MYTLPCYSIGADDIYSSYHKHLRFLRELSIGAPAGRIPVKDTRRVVRELILSRATRDVVKESFGVSSAQWRR